MPTFAESGLSDYSAGLWYGLVAPAGTPEPIVNRLNAAVRKALQQPDVKAKLTAMGAEGMEMTPAEFAQLIKTDVALWKGVIQKAGIVPN